MKICFLMRHDYESKSGGDVVQINAYISELKKIGYDCSIENKINKTIIENHDCFILVNIDRPIETIHYYHYIRRMCSKRIYVVPIHHPIKAIERFERNNKGLLYATLCAFIPDFYDREKIKNLARFTKSLTLTKISIAHLFFNYRRELASLLNSADGIIYISNGERASVENDFSVTNRKFVVAPNAVDLSDTPPHLYAKKYDIIVVGRIEPRKNQLKIANHLTPLGKSVIFVGPANNNAKKYFQQFQSAISTSSENISYLGRRTHRETMELIAQSKILINSSYFEVNPLVDLEAATVGTHVITTKNSYTREFLPSAVEIDPWNLDDLNNHIDTIIASRLDTLKNANINESWKNTATKISTLLSL